MKDFKWLERTIEFSMWLLVLVAGLLILAALSGCSGLKTLADNWPQPSEVHYNQDGSIRARVYK